MANFVGLHLLILVTIGCVSAGLLDMLEQSYFASTVALQPWPLSVVKPQILVYTRQQNTQTTFTDNSQIPGFVNGLITNGFLSANRHVIFIVHGYMGYIWPFNKWLGTIKDAILNVEDSTIFVVNWSGGADAFYSYPSSAANTQTVGWLLSNVTTAILNSSVFNGDKDSLYVHCIGHSLGAQICGKAGRRSQLFDRVTGLDPAGPAFENVANSGHIDVDSGTCVDNIHTDGQTHAGILDSWSPHFGTLQKWGHINFYVNGGGNQPGCWSNTMPPCSHMAATVYFPKTIDPTNSAYQLDAYCQGSDCPSTNVTQKMGYYSSCHYKNNAQVLSGTYHLSSVVNGANVFGSLEFK